MDSKEALLKFCQDHVGDKRKILLQRSASLQESLNSETKSSAGDKHETGRAMVQLEQEKLGQQLVELDKMTLVLKRINLDSNGKKISLGSFIKASSASYFIAVSAGAYKIADGSAVFCVSANSPVAQLLLGKEEGDSFVLNKKEHHILAVL